MVHQIQRCNLIFKPAKCGPFSVRVSYIHALGSCDHLTQVVTCCVLATTLIEFVHLPHYFVWALGALPGPGVIWCGLFETAVLRNMLLTGSSPTLFSGPMCWWQQVQGGSDPWRCQCPGLIQRMGFFPPANLECMHPQTIYLAIPRLRNCESHLAKENSDGKQK